MTLRTLFAIILKIFGLLFLKEIIQSIPQLFSSFLFFGRSSQEAGTATFIFTLLIIAFYCFLTFVLLFKTDRIVDILHLDKDFVQQEIAITFSPAWVFTIAIIVIGGLILVNEVPNFFRYLLLYLEEKRVAFGTSKPNVSPLILAGVKIVIALLLIGERKRIVRLTNSSE